MKTKTILSFTVKRSRWCRGYSNLSSDGTSCLLTDKNTMCCLGFACRAAGYKGRMRDFRRPDNIKKELFGLNGISMDVGVYNTQFSIEAMSINDDRGISDKQRESRLIKLGKEHGIEIKFID